NYENSAGSFQGLNLLDLRAQQAVTLGNDWDYVSKLWKKYFRLPGRVIQRADEFPPLDHALGLHYRGTDKNKSLGETNFVSEDDFLALAKDFVATHPEIKTIFVATDENAFVEQVRPQHPGLDIFNSGRVTHHKDLLSENNFAKGDHALLDCLLLSRCQYLLKSQSALSGFAKVLNPRLEAYRVSANKLAAWNWSIPYFPDAYLPMLSSQNPACQKILARLCAGDWTEHKGMQRKFGKLFKYKNRKGYERRGYRAPLWGFDGVRMRFDSRAARLLNSLGL
ncbi:MAG TPA: hypothetical protein PLB25_21290, partial [Rhodoferax sp.]|nr:hypothetical protein [Rhodoferax sp.]